MNILLVYPQYPDTYWSFKHVLKFVSRKATFPPLGLLTVAALLPQEWDKKLVDLNVTELKDEQITWADMVFLSAMIVQTDSAREVIRRCKALGKTIVAGGPAATTGHEKLAGVDHFVLNEAEITLPRFLADWKQGRPQAIYESNERPDITRTPVPLWSLIKFKDYVTLPIQYSRGCPFDCEFCDIIVMYGRTPRTKSPEQMIREMNAIRQAGWKGDVFIVDDNFIGNKSRVKKMLPVLSRWQKKHKYPFTFTTEASTNLAEDEELMQLMSAANFKKVFVGIETPSIDSLKECGKYQNTSQSLEEAVTRIQKNGMQVMGGFIVGFDNDTDGIFEAQIKFIQKVGIVTAMVGLLNALPQTRLWHRLKAEGRLLQDTTGENTDASLNYIPIMAKEKLLAGYQKIVSTIYSPKHYYERIYTFIRHYKPRAKSKVSFRDLQAAIKSVWHIGILSRARFHYWKLILKTSLRKFNALPAAIELAIYGFHFERVSAKITRV
jgi:radical SAM superfamily enzyme YgiQ (UPF0313 family)